MLGYKLYDSEDEESIFKDFSSQKSDGRISEPIYISPTDRK